MHRSPDYSAAYVVLHTDDPALSGHGLTFTNGRGTEVCVAAIRALEPLVVGRTLEGITGDFAGFWRSLVSEDQLRWLGPEKGVMHVSTAAVVNAVWDLWAKTRGVPVWRLLADLSPEEIVSIVDFRYIADALRAGRGGGAPAGTRCRGGDEREHDATRRAGIPRTRPPPVGSATTTRRSSSWCASRSTEGFRHVKMKVGGDTESDVTRAGLIRAMLGDWRHADDGCQPGVGRGRGDRDDARARGVRPVVDRRADEPRRRARARTHSRRPSRRSRSRLASMCRTGSSSSSCSRPERSTSCRSTRAGSQA